MSDQGSGFPPEQVQGEASTSGEWETVPPASAGGAAPPSGAGTPPPPDYPPPPPGYVPPPPTWVQPPPGQASAGLSLNAAAAISYITIIPAIVFLVLEPYKRSDYVRFHAWQCISLFVVGLLAKYVLLMIGFLGVMLYVLLSLAIVVFWLIALVKASQGVRYHIPGVGELAEQLTRSVQI